jgi:hypothetical protein
MTEQEVLQESKENPTEFVVWTGDKSDWFRTRDEAIYFLGYYIGNGCDAQGHPSWSGGVYHQGAQTFSRQEASMAGRGRCPHCQHFTIRSGQV